MNFRKRIFTNEFSQTNFHILNSLNEFAEQNRCVWGTGYFEAKTPSHSKNPLSLKRVSTYVRIYILQRIYKGLQIIAKTPSLFFGF